MLRAHALEYLARRGPKLSKQERRVLAQLVSCRTARMGGHAWKCDTCGAVRASYDSCRNRHCPTCRGAARAKWLDRVRQDLLPLPYFHAVQTLPHDPQLDRVTRANAALIYGLLFRSTAAALVQLAADPRHLGARIGLLIVLHTWGQLMNQHTHVHIVVPGGGLSLDGERWIRCRDGFFLPVEVIGALVRGKFLAGLKRLWREGELKLEGKLSHLAEKRQFEAWLSTLYAKKWVAFAQGPKSGTKGPDAVLKYLARYVSGVAIPDKRLVSHADGRVTFRWKDYGRGGLEATTSLAGVEFVARYMQHVLPRGFVRIRYYGLLSHGHRQQHLARCRELLGVESAAASSEAAASKCSAAADAKRPAKSEAAACASCGRGRLVLFDAWPRVQGWPWELRGSESTASQRHMANTVEEFMARRSNASTTQRTRAAVGRDPSAAVRRDTS